MPVIAKLVVVAWLVVAKFAVKLPNVEDALVRIPALRSARPPTLRVPPIVEDAVTASAEVVAPVAERLRSVVRPVFDMEKSVEFTPEEVVEEIAKSVVVADVLAAKILKSAVGFGVDEPMESPLRKEAASN